MFVRAIGIYLFVLSFSFSSAQEKEQSFGTEGQFTFETDTPYKLLELDEATLEPIPQTTKKPKRKTFFGIKTRKRFSAKGFGDKRVVEFYHILKKSVENTSFVRDIYWYSYERRGIQKTAKFDLKKGALLHGPYRKMMGMTLLEEGVFYKGTKHGRWMHYDRQDILEDKEKYYKGWPKESLITYYDPTTRTKIKEIVPIEIREREGYYYLFHENGTIAVTGEYKWGERVGDWTENYMNGKRKKTISYSKQPYNKNNPPFVRREWDEKGQEVFSSNQQFNN